MRDDEGLREGLIDRPQTLLRLGKRALRYWKGALCVALVGLGATAGIVYLNRPTYRSETVLLYRSGARQGFGDELDSGRRAGFRLQDMLFARERYRRILDEMQLYPGVDPGAAVEEMIKKTTFKVREGSTFGITFEADDPKLAQAVTRRLADSLIADNANQRRSDTETNRDFLDNERKRVETLLRQKETALADFLYKHPEFAAAAAQPGAVAPTLRAEATPGTDPMASILTMEMQLEELRARHAAAATAPVVATPVMRASPELLAARARAEADLAQAEATLSDLKGRLTDAHPDVVNAAAKVRVAKAALDRVSAEMDRTAGTAGPSVATSSPTATLERQMHLLEQQIARARRRYAPAAPRGSEKEAVATELQWQKVSREVAEARERFEKLGDKQFQAELLATLESSGQAIGLLVVVDPAFLPVLPARNTRAKIAMAGVIVSLMLGLGFAAVRALTDDRVFDVEDVERYTGYPVLAAVPRGGLLEAHERG